MYSKEVYEEPPVYVATLKDMEEYISTELEDAFIFYATDYFDACSLFSLMYYYSSDNPEILKEIIKLIEECQNNFFENEKDNWFKKQFGLIKRKNG